MHEHHRGRQLVEPDAVALPELRGRGDLLEDVHRGGAGQAAAAAAADHGEEVAAVGVVRRYAQSRRCAQQGARHDEVRVHDAAAGQAGRSALLLRHTAGAGQVQGRCRAGAGQVQGASLAATPLCYSH